ncbi:MAG: polysaccharide deacetylase family protein [Planctomycetes bacterium]|nr:polysaccharide deacetylase family protein [Planctomycetota bacterium]
MTLIVRTNDRYLPERRYILDVLLREFLGLEYKLVPHDLQEVHIVGEDEPFGRQLRIADVFFQTPEHDWLNPSSQPTSPLQQCRVPSQWTDTKTIDNNLPVLFGRPMQDGSYFKESDDAINIGIDIFGSAFFMLTRYEEAASKQRDSHGRFPAEQSIASREEFLERPLVNEYLEVLWSALSRLYPNIKRAERHYRLFLSHDVDLPLMHSRRDSWRGVMRRSWDDLYGRRNPGLATRRISSYFYRCRLGDDSHDPYNTHDFLMNVSDLHGVKSAFYFMAGATHSVYDPDAATEEPFIGTLLKTVSERGHEIGFHPSYETCDNFEQTQSEFDSLMTLANKQGVEIDQCGGRQHFLRWQNPRTWQNWERIGASYDSTLGFAEQAGFRCGTCYEYPVFDLQSRRPQKLRERPLIASDTALLNYMKLVPENAAAKIKQLSERCAMFAGDFSLLVHNSTLFSASRRRWYSSVVKSVA